MQLIPDHALQAVELSGSGSPISRLSLELYGEYTGSFLLLLNPRSDCRKPSCHSYSIAFNMSTAAPINPIFDRIYNLQSLAECKETYDQWAASYDADVNDPASRYAGPSRVAESVRIHGDINGTILDAGCGTGLCGVALSSHGARTIDGLDFSPGMLDMARKTGAYRKLAIADLSKPIEKPNAAYDVVTCVGTLTKTHVGPDPALKEFVRIIKTNGIVVATVLDNIWISGGYAAEVERLGREGLVDVVSTENGDYRHDLQARIIVLRKK